MTANRRLPFKISLAAKFLSVVLTPIQLAFARLSDSREVLTKIKLNECSITMEPGTAGYMSIKVVF